MPKASVLLQLDTDPQPSSFDAIVAVDAGVERLLPYGDVTAEKVESLVHGAMFTRGGEDLASTALFFGGSDVRAVERVVQRARDCFFGPVRVSWMADPNGSNTTAAAAVLSAEAHLTLAGTTVVVLGGTGPVGSRIAQLAAHRDAAVRLVSRSLSRSESVCDWLRNVQPGADFEPVAAASPDETASAIRNADVVFGAGAAGIALLEPGWEHADGAPQIAIDLNAVPPAGLPGVEATDRGERRGDLICYGALGVGRLKMKLHRRCLQQLFEGNDREFDTVAIYDCGREMASTS